MLLLTNERPVTTTSSQIVRCPAMPTCPPIMQRAPIVVLPEMPLQPAIAVCAPMRTLWPIWIWLSSLTPSLDHRVLDRAAIDRGVGADFDVVADAHAAELRDLEPLALGRRQAEAVRADHDAGMHQAALAERRPSCTA